MGGKFIACLSGISAFVAIGLEHCIANMVSAYLRSPATSARRVLYAVRLLQPQTIR